MKKMVSIFTLFIASFLFLAGCGGSSIFSPEESIVGKPNGSLLKSEQVGSISASLLFPYPAKAYKITYITTDTDNKKIKASGLLAVPDKALGEKSPLLSYQHGTIFLDGQAPSNSATSINAISKLAGTGYIVSAPDYIGYGESASTIHPYIHASSLASSAIDMLRASKAFLSSQNIKINEQLFLAGYSEGGYATLALQKAIQDNYSAEFTVTASAAGAGPYDLISTAETLAYKETNDKPAYMSFLLKAYSDIYHLNKVSDMYQHQYVGVINSVFDGKHSASQITSQLSTTTAQLFNPVFLAALQGTGDHVIKTKLAENNIYDWKPTAPTRLFHSPQDEIVPYQNQLTAYNAMRAKGATNLTKKDCILNSHVSCAIPYVLDAILFFVNHADDL